MKAQTKLVRIVTPPPIGVNNLLHGETLQATTTKALALQLQKSIPTSTARTVPHKVHLVTIHPSQPLVAYLLVPDGNTDAIKKKYHPKSVVVQHLKTRQVVYQISLNDITTTLFELDVLSKAAPPRQSKLLKDLGQVQGLQFVDPSTLYWSGFMEWGQQRGKDGVGGDGMANGGSTTSSGGAAMQRFSYLFVQFTNRIIILNLRRGSTHIVTQNRKPSMPKTFLPIQAHITQEMISGGSNGGGGGSSGSILISSNPLPISQHTMLVATTDGNLKVYDWSKKLVTKTFKNIIPIKQSKNDWIVYLCPTNKFLHYWNGIIAADGGSSTVGGGPSSSGGIGSGGTPGNGSSDGKALTKRFVMLTKKGVAYLTEMQMSANDPTVIEDIVTPPLARFDGGSVPTSMSKQDDDHSSMEHILMQYDAYRDILIWCAPAKSKSRLMVWDLNPSNMPEPDAKQKKKGEPVKPDPILVMQFPYEQISHAIFPGWLHESVPMDSMTCVAVTKEGECFQVLVAPLNSPGSTSMKNPFHAVTILSVDLNDIVQRDMQLPTDGPHSQVQLRVQSVYCPPLRDSSTFYLGTNMGLLVLRMVDGNLVPVPGPRHAHLSANVGSLGKSVLSVKNSEVIYGSLEPVGNSASTTSTTTALLSGNPIGEMKSTSNMVVYESPPPLHLPPEIHKRPVRLPPCFLPSPSRNYLCCFWKEEMRYEVLHIPTMLQRVSSRSDVGNKPLVASGNGVASFAWVGDEDVFGLLYDPEQDLALKVGIDLSAPQATLGKELANAAKNATDLRKLKELKRLKDIASVKTVKGSAQMLVGTAAKLKSLEGLREIAKDTGKVATGGVKGLTNLGVGTVKLTGKVAVGTVKGTTKVAVGTVKGTTKLAGDTVKGTAKVTVGTVKLGVKGTKKVTKGAVGGTTKITKSVANVASFGLLKRRQQKAQNEAGSGLASAEHDEDDEVQPNTANAPLDAVNENGGNDNNEEQLASEQLERKHPWVELRILAPDGTSPDAPGTQSSLGQLTLRSGNRNPPTVLFGGPVLCVASKLDEHDEGLAYFYTRRKGQDDTRASVYVSSGPAFPCPDLIAWDDEGRLCAVVIQSRVAVYLSEEPEFILLGTTRLGSSSDADVQVVSIRFIHGVLYCTTRSSVQCVFLGDLEGGICHLDTFTLVSSDVPVIPQTSLVTEYNSLTPPTIPMPLNHPTILGYQNGSLMLSTVTGLQAIPLNHPLLRIGTLIGAGHHSRAERWFDAVPEQDHEALATFLDRRGVPEMALQLTGLSLETTVDYCMKYGFTDRLEEVVDMFGIRGLRAVDMGRGVSSNSFGLEENGTSVVVCVGAYLLSQGRVELVRRLATECLSSGEDGKKEAFILASLLLSVDGSDSKRVLQRAVEDVDDSSDWLVGNYVREHVLTS